MSKQELVERGKQIFNNIKNLDSEKLLRNPENLQPWNGLNFNDFAKAYKDLISSLDLIYESEILIESPFNLINGLNNNLNYVLQHCNQFINNKSQVYFQNAFQYIENLRTNIYTWGLKYQVILGKNIEEKVTILNDEINKIITKEKEIDALKINVESLIQPAVAGSLSKSFSKRKDNLVSNRKTWFIVLIFAAIIGIIATIMIIHSIVGIFGSKTIANLIAKSSSDKEEIIWLSVILRLGILLPIYTIFGFVFSQYRKERDLEEQYAHKSAVATSLPNYGDLAIDDKVKDQILSEASKVIFHAPSGKYGNKTGREVLSIDQLNSLLKGLSRFIPKTKE